MEVISSSKIKTHMRAMASFLHHPACLQLDPRWTWHCRDFILQQDYRCPLALCEHERENFGVQTLPPQQESE